MGVSAAYVFDQKMLIIDYRSFFYEYLSLLCRWRIVPEPYNGSDEEHFSGAGRLIFVQECWHCCSGKLRADCYITLLYYAVQKKRALNIW